MAGFFSKFSRTAKATVKAIEASKAIHSYSLQGIAITCPHCKGDQFDEAPALLNTSGMTFLKLDWLNRTAAILVCRRCGQIQWFLQKPEKISVGDNVEIKK